MSVRAPHFVLFSDARTLPSPTPHDGGRYDGGRWSFWLRAPDGTSVVEADGYEPDPGTRGERLELLSVVRGLEALDQPSRVTLVTTSRYVRRGLRFGLDEWRRNGWCWEHFGRLVPVKDQDLWQRVDTAMRYHDVQCRYWRLDSAAGDFDNAPLCGAAPGRFPANDGSDGARARLLDILSQPGRWLWRSLRVLVTGGFVGRLALSGGD